MTTTISEFATATRIVFGAGAVQQLAELTRGFGRHALVVTGRSPERGAVAARLLQADGVATTTCAVGHEPDLALVRAGVEVARQAGCDFLVGVGGGSALDTAKAIAALLTNDGDVLEYLEVVGRGRPLANGPVPCVAVPTTAGTGSEVTRNAVIGVPEQRVKVSLRSPLMLPRLAIVDPELTLGLPAPVTISTGLDALTQLIEPYVSCRATPITDVLCLRGIQLAPRVLLRAVETPSDLTAREQMCLASLWGGMALANAGLGAVHGIAGPIGGMFDAPHGAVCAALLPHVMRVNVQALAARAPGHPALERYDQIAALLTGSPDARAIDATTWIEGLVRRLGVPRLRTYGVTAADLADIAARSGQASSMKGNPVRLTPDELGSILAGAL
jgi:alcohol dehydrogenase class IV